MKKYSVLEVCAGAGGQALGMELAGFNTQAAVEIDKDACSTLRHNRPNWNVVEADLKEFSASEYSGVDVLAGGVPCPPFSVAGNQLGADDERDLFPTALRLVRECNPKAVLLENVRGLASSRFADYRKNIISDLGSQGYEIFWQLVKASDFSVPQLRPRFVLVAVKQAYAAHFSFPKPVQRTLTVANALYDLMSANGWAGADAWKEQASDIAPTLVGGSKKHGGADLGPTRAKRQWAELGVDGKGIANDPPSASDDPSLLPRLTIRMTARIQGFPDHWEFQGGKTSQYRQIGNAFPPPVAQAIGSAIIDALDQKPLQTQGKEELSLTLAAE